MTRKPNTGKKWKKPTLPSYQALDRVAKIIEREVSWFNGWTATDDAVKRSCRGAAELVFDYLFVNSKIHG